ncbi:thioesterase [Sphingopyxis sp. H038]|jgi:uncharacterized protein (TIGR00369 family)|uniref:Uncharacterized protein (TIGR00369 family) n=1 Tax=Sphingopyxis italica TaxID=1129133 RepID=A0A7X5XNT8_9SPHN|nr:MULTISPECIES: hotdog fold thioesterase [Sphingopyxis]MBN8842799.1 hotdog fold thioesterase [Sphingomonadales bacterium]MBU0824216.1 hotdog fold thioesterase [Alphaproteobacteria bacterium]KGB52018.1 Thioesterase superfamily protein precursor [Sphingopyxis sp. LC363]KTE00534.1 thioesterase [Sphingopyxis sp. H012]KTE08299.1 thioesterase [Sphingopyxis sp. H053]
MNAPRVAPGLEELGELLLLAPFHRWLGLRIAEVGTDELVISMPWRDEIISNPTVGAAHGGILSALIDLTGLYTVIAMGGSARATANLHVDFHRPALPGLMRAIGRPVKLGRQISIAGTRIVSADGTLIASGRGAYVA